MNGSSSMDFHHFWKLQPSPPCNPDHEFWVYGLGDFEQTLKMNENAQERHGSSNCFENVEVATG